MLRVSHKKINHNKTSENLLNEILTQRCRRNNSCTHPKIHAITKVNIETVFIENIVCTCFNGLHQISTSKLTVIKKS